MRSKKHHITTTLSTRLMLGLSFPLLFLTLAFTAMQLANQMNAMNEFYKIESRFAFESIHKALTAELGQNKNFSDQDSLLEKLQRMQEFHHVGPIGVYHLFEHRLIVPDVAAEWSPADFQAMERSLYQKQLGKTYDVHVDKEKKRVVAYLPMEGHTPEQIYVARVAFPLAHIGDALNKSRWTLGIMFFFIILTGYFIGQGFAKSIVGPIRDLNAATQEIVEGHLGKHVEIHTGDEIEKLADTFNHMSESLKAMKERAEDANPLTGLPGNQGIFHEVKKRLYERQKFVLFHIDLDRFKVFNDHFGLGRGDEAIERTAELLKLAVKEKGRKDDFLGHQGGDDFVVITQPSHAKAMAEEIVKRFDKEIVPALYRKEDLERGYTLQIDRRRLAETGEERMVEFPLLSISLAGVTNIKKDFADYFGCMQAAVLVKKEVKKTVQSSYLIQE